MQRLIATLVVVAGALSALPFAANAAAAPSLRALPSASVLTLSGQGFSPRDQLELTVVSGHPYRIHVAVSAHGTFSVRVPGRPRCAAWTATAKGSGTGSARFRSDVPACRSIVALGYIATGPEPAATPESPTTGGTGTTPVVREHFDPGGGG